MEIGILIPTEDTMETRAKAASSGKLTSESMWDEWEAKLINLTGAACVPYHVIREQQDHVSTIFTTVTFVSRFVSRDSKTLNSNGQCKQSFHVALFRTRRRGGRGTHAMTRKALTFSPTTTKRTCHTTTLHCTSIEQSHTTKN